MRAQIDSLSIADLESRYNVNRSNLYKRINSLKEKGYPLEFETRNRKSYANADQIALMDAFHDHVSSGNSMNTFPAMGEGENAEELSLTVSRQFEMSHKTKDTNGNGSAIVPKQASQLIALSPEQLIELATAIASPAPASPVDPFENLETLKRVCENGWWLSSSQLKPLLNRATLPSTEFQAFGYTFTPAGKHGQEKAWKIEKA